MPSYSEQRYRSQDGLSLYYRDYQKPDADGLPVICLTGLTRNSRDYDRIAEVISEKRRVICPDYRGRGLSDYDPDWRNYRPPVYVNDVRHLLAVTGIHRAAFIGTSLGGFLTMGLSILAPMAIAGVVLNDVGPQVDMSAADDIVDRISVDQPEPDMDHAIRTARKLFPEVTGWNDDIFREVTEATYRLGDDGQLHFDWDVKLAEPMKKARGVTTDLWALFGGLAHMPLLAIRGGVSKLLTEEGLEKMMAAHPDGTSVTLDGVGHAPRLYEAEAQSAILEFLDRVDQQEQSGHTHPVR